MKICSIISEYNPFHLGHEYHIGRTRDFGGADKVVCVMSGSFVQRGETAVYDKWLRAKCALAAGADAVIELPVIGVLQSAQGFAEAGVKTAAFSTHLSFGCETDDLALLSDAAALTQSDEYSSLLKEHLSSGATYAAAAAKAAGRLLSLDVERARLISKPNAILAIEYIRAIQKWAPHIKPIPVKRLGDYHGEDDSNGYAGASAVRKLMFADQDYSMHLPKYAADSFAGVSPRCTETLYPAVMSVLMNSDLKSIAGVSEGIENRFLHCIDSSSLTILEERVKTKRYVLGAIRRIYLNALLNIDKRLQADYNASPATYLHVLGVRSANILSALSPYNAVTCAADYSDVFFEKDILATNLADMGTHFNRDFKAALLKL